MAEHPRVVSEHPNVTRLREVIAAFGAGDIDAVVAAYSPDAVYRVPGTSTLSGVYRGRDEIRGLLMRFGQLSGGVRLEPTDILADDGQATFFWSGTLGGQEKSLDASGAMTFRIAVDGSYSESWFLFNDQRAFDAYFS